jgi:hypothetical protein
LKFEVYENELNRVVKELSLTQELHRNLAIYKNQEYPEKLLYINNLRKKLDDLNNLHNEERENLDEMIYNDKINQKTNRIQMTKQIADDVSKVSLQF